MFGHIFAKKEGNIGTCKGGKSHKKANTPKKIQRKKICEYMFTGAHYNMLAPYCFQKGNPKKIFNYRSSI